MKILKNNFIKYRHAIPLLIYGIIYMAWFSHLEQTVTSHYQVIHVALDDHIPFCEVFVVPYLMWFAYVALVILYFFFRNKTTISGHALSSLPV